MTTKAKDDVKPAEAPVPADSPTPAAEQKPVPVAAEKQAPVAAEKPAGECVVDDGTPHTGRAVNGKVCSAHAIHYRADGARR